MRGLFAVLIVAACGKTDPAPPAEHKTDLPKLDVAKALAPAAPANPTGALDFDLAERGGAYVLSDEAYEMTFPFKPNVTPLPFSLPNGTKMTAMQAISSDSEADASYTASVTPFHLDAGVDAKRGLDNVRDKILESVHAKLLSETAVKLAGRDARRLTASTESGGKTVYLDVRSLWDPDHRAIVILQSAGVVPDPTARARAFFDSLIVHPGHGSPLFGPSPKQGTAVPANVLDLSLVRSGESYAVRDESLEIVFPVRPVLEEDKSLPSGLTSFQATAYTGEHEMFMVSGVFVPKATPYDPAKGMAGTRDALLATKGVVKNSVTNTTVAKLPGQRIQASGKLDGYPAKIEIEIVWDPEHRVLVTAWAVTSEQATTPAGRAFLDSLTFK